MKFKTIITKISIHLESESPIYGENTVTVELDDEAGGIFLVITNHEGVKVSMDIEQWERVKLAVEKLKKQKCEGML